MDDIYLFLAHAVKLETDSARRFEELAEAMATSGNREVQEFFRRMAHFSRLHLADATARSGFRPLPDLAAEEYQWPEETSPETAGWMGVDGFMAVEDALNLALKSERAGLAFYASIVSSSRNPRVRIAAEEFAAEEAEHVAELERWIKRLAKGAEPISSTASDANPTPQP